MKFGKYTIKFSERGKHYGEILGGLFFIAVMVISVSAVTMWLVGAGELETSEDVQAETVSEYSNLEVRHIYEDGCIDLYDTEKDTYRFMCEDMSFYE